MKNIKYAGLALFLLGIFIFIGTLFLGNFNLSEQAFKESVSETEYNNLLPSFQKEILNTTFTSSFALSGEIVELYKTKNAELKAKEEWDKVMYSDPHRLAFSLLKPSATGLIAGNKWLFFFLTFGLGIFGGLMYILPDAILLGAPGIKNNGIFHASSTNRGWLGWLVFGFLISFYVLLYFFPDYITNWTLLVDPISKNLNGGAASQWFLYGFLYCVVMLVMGIRMYVKYRHNNYQIVRTTSVLFFQLIIAFLIPEFLARMNLPARDLKNIWPLDYSFFFDYNLEYLVNSGNLGLFMLFWGVVLFLLIVPVMTYFFGKRWYCSWVCGCGGLAETLGDPYRQLSDKSLKAWKIERYLIYSVLVFALIMSVAVAWHSFTKINSGYEAQETFLGISVFNLRHWYGFLIGSIFAGVIGTGFYPIFGNRVWCRFGCPLAAYMGIIQRFKSRFRITVNGGQCISCGNCSTYCEMGIDVRWYAQRGQDFARASCVGCGVCSAVCPRGVLKLENLKEELTNLNKVEHVETA
ncbi:MAG: 4Fe-4S binding protein [Bacteroidetes bacterium]|nr:4Fe-4S binding protein [Bacteroidota bacterium]